MAELSLIDSIHFYCGFGIVLGLDVMSSIQQELQNGAGRFSNYNCKPNHRIKCVIECSVLFTSPKTNFGGLQHLLCFMPVFFMLCSKTRTRNHDLFYHNHSSRSLFFDLFKVSSNFESYVTFQRPMQVFN